MGSPDTSLPSQWVPSANFTPRRPESVPARQPDMLVLHYTAMASSERALYWLTAEHSQVSAHYLIDEFGHIFQMVREADRAWQAGISMWQGETDINSCSIGIEIHNEGPWSANPGFPDAQMDAVAALCTDIAGRNGIPQCRVLAHSDISPARKVDPGPYFDWPRLAKAGIGLWPHPLKDIPERPTVSLGEEGDGVADIQRDLARFGYGIITTGIYDDFTETVISALQLHWRQNCVDGQMDAETQAILNRLLDISELTV